MGREKERQRKKERERERMSEISMMVRKRVMRVRVFTVLEIALVFFYLDTPHL